MFTPVNKTSNMYELTKDENNHLLDNAVTATCKKATKGIKILQTKKHKVPKQADIFDKIEIKGTIFL